MGKIMPDLGMYVKSPLLATQPRLVLRRFLLNGLD
jgi:hypothetical protein